MYKEKCEHRDCNEYIWYSKEPPPSIRLDGIKLKQKEHTCYVVVTSARNLDRLCKVPEIDVSKDNAVLARLALDPKTEQWQRMLDFNRVDDISQFFQGPHNFFVNAVILSLPTEYADFETISGQSLVAQTIEPDWMKQECPVCHYYLSESKGGEERRYWFDRCPNHECTEHKKDTRPGVIIDGQHRIRGTQGKHCTGSNPEQLMLAVVLTENEFDRSAQAKIFTEITTSAVDLEPLHKIFLLYKFRLRGSQNILSLDPDFRDDSDLGRRNRRAYEIACHLCSRSPTSKWYDGITILRDLGGRRRRGDYIEVAGFVRTVSDWLGSSVFRDAEQPDSIKSVTDACDELDDYLKAVVQTWPGEDLWNDDRRSPGHLQDRGIFECLLNLYSTVAERIDERGAQRSLSEFKKELHRLSGIQWVPDWTRLNDPDRNRTLLLKILQSRLKNAPKADDPSYCPDPTINDYIKKEPDRFDWTLITKKLNGKSLSKTSFPITFEWSQPTNAYTNAEFEICQGDEMLFRDETIGTKWELRECPPGIETVIGSPEITVAVVYTNHTGKYKRNEIKMAP